jgi:hypothetical protein
MGGWTWGLIHLSFPSESPSPFSLKLNSHTSNPGQGGSNCQTLIRPEIAASSHYSAPEDTKASERIPRYIIDENITSDVADQEAIIERSLAVLPNLREKIEILTSDSSLCGANSPDAIHSALPTTPLVSMITALKLTIEKGLMVF